MIPTIKVIEGKKLIGFNQTMSLVNNETAKLWQSFMTNRHEIKNALGTDLISMQIYSESYFKSFEPSAVFTKWACAEVSDYEHISKDMKTFNLPTGLYAIFNYKGLPSAAEPFFNYIFSEWIPNSIYELDNRPHFEILGSKYSPINPQSEEEVCVPIKPKS